MRLIPSSCDLDLAIVNRYIKITENIIGSVYPFTFEISKSGNNLYIITLSLERNILQQSKLNVNLSYLSGFMFVPKKIIPNPSLESIAEAAPTVGDTLTGILGGSFIGTLALGATPSLWSIISFQQFIGYFIYINIEYPYHVEIFLRMLQNSMWELLPNPAASLTESLYQKVLGEGIDSELVPPRKFVKYGITSFFIENGGAILLTNLFLLILLFLILALKRKESLKNNIILKTLKVWLKWNLIARTFLENGIPLSLAIFLQLTALSFDGSYFKICMVMLFIASVYLIVFVIFLFRILYKRENKLLDRKLIRRIYGTLYEGVTLKTSAKYYHLIILSRGFLVTFLVTMVDSFPTLQIVPLIFFNAGFLYFLFKEIAMDDSKLNTITRIKEILILLGEIGILFLAFQLTSESYYNVLGWIVVALFFSAILIELVYMLILQIVGIKDIIKNFQTNYKAFKKFLEDCFGKKKDLKVHTIKIENRCLNEPSNVSSESVCL